MGYSDSVCAALWVQYERLIKDNGAIVLTASQPFTSVLIVSKLDWFKYCWIWEKPQGVDPFMSKYRPLNNYEDVCVFSNGTPPYNPQLIKGREYVVVRDKNPRVKETTQTRMKQTVTVNAGL
jgi:hypothetical protein